MQSGKLVPLSTSLLGRWGPNFHCCWSVAQSRPTPCNPMDCSMPGFPVHHQLLEFAQTHVYSMAPHSSTLAWKIPWMEEPGRLQPLGLLTVRHDWATSLSCIGEGNGKPLQWYCLENPRDGGAWWALSLRSHRVRHDWSDLAAAACLFNWWCHPTISSSAAPFSSCPQSFPVSGSFPMSWLSASGGPSTGALVSASVLPMNIQGWFPLGLTGLISWQSKGLSRDFFLAPQFKSLNSLVLRI